MIYMLLGLEKNSERPGLETESSLGGQPGNINIDASCPAISSSTFRHPLRQQPGKKLHVQGRQKHQQNQDLLPDSSSHPKARGLLSWIWDTGILTEVGRGPSWEVAQQADLNSLNKTWIAIRLVIEKRLVLILLGLYM